MRFVLSPRRTTSFFGRIAPVFGFWCVLAQGLVAGEHFTPLTRALRMENFGEARKHMTPESVNQPDRAGYHPLTYAVYAGDAGIVGALLKAGADPDMVEPNGKTALYVAANLGRPDIIRLLHRYGAKLPGGYNALPPGRAAVFSGCPETLAALLDAYPRLDLARGWDSQSAPDLGNSLGGPLGYAIQHACNEVALVLLKHGVDPTTTGFGRSRALEFAARDARCSLEVVEALLARGMDPSRALRFAAADGALAKVRAMLRKLPANTSAGAIGQAAYAACACNRPETAKVLFEAIGKDIPDFEAVLRDIESRPYPSRARQFRRSIETDKGAELPELLPVPRPRQPDPRRSGAVAIVSPEPLRDIASLLTAKLGAAEGVTVLERDALEKILEEHGLAEFQARDSAALSRALPLIPADHVLVLSVRRFGVKSFIEMALLNTRLGIVAERLAVPRDVAPADLAPIAARMAAIVRNSPAARDKIVAVSLTPLTPEVPDPDTLSIIRRMNTLLPFLANRTTGCVVLDREQLAHLEQEKALGIQGSYWSAGWVIDGGLRIQNPGRLSITLRATNVVDGREEHLARTAPLEDADAALASAWKALAAKLSPSAKLRETPRQPNEARLLARQARWLHDAGYFIDSLALATNALILDPENPALLRLALDARLRTLPALPYAVEGSISRNPRILEPDLKYPLTRQFDAYFGLADLALQYARLIDSHLTGRQWIGGVFHRNPETYDEFLTRSLWELCFFRTMMDDVIIGRKRPGDLRRLDVLIAELTNTYLDKAKDDPTESRTIGAVLGSDFGYFALHNPKLLEQAMTRAIGLGGGATLVARRYREAVTHNRPKSVWEKGLKLLDTSPDAATQMELAACRFHVARTRKDRLDAASVIRWLYPATPVFPFPKDTLSRFLGCDATAWCDFQMIYRPVPPGGFEAYLLGSAKELRKTGEFQRMLPLYAWALSLESIPAHWEKILYRARHAEPKFGTRPKPVTPAGWKVLREIALRNKRLPEEIKSQLDSLAQPKPASVNAPTKGGTHPTKHKTPAGQEFRTLHLEAPAILLPPSGIAGLPGQIAHPDLAAPAGEILWLPVSYLAPGGKKRTPRRTSLGIHMIDLHKLSVFSTLKVPDTPDLFEPAGPPDPTAAPSDLARIFLSDRYMYIHGVSPGVGSTLYCYDLKAKKFHKVPLPLPYIIATSRKAVGDTIYLSVTELGDPYARRLANMVVAVEGTKVRKILVSSRRKPPLSPLDDPTTRVTRIRRFSDKLVLFSNPGHGDGHPTWVKTAMLDTSTGAWRLLPKEEAAQYKARARQCADDRHVERECSVRVLKKTCHFLRGGRTVPFLEFSTNRIIAERNASRARVDPRARKLLWRIPVTVSPVEDPQWNQPVFPAPEATGADVRNPASSWCSANDLIRQRKFGVFVVGVWAGNYQVLLHNNLKALPGIWRVSREDMARAVAAALEESPPPPHR